MNLITGFGVLFFCCFATLSLLCLIVFLTELSPFRENIFTFMFMINFIDAEELVPKLKFFFQMLVHVRLTFFFCFLLSSFAGDIFVFNLDKQRPQSLFK